MLNKDIGERNSFKKNFVDYTKNDLQILNIGRMCFVL